MEYNDDDPLEFPDDSNNDNEEIYSGYFKLINSQIIDLNYNQLYKEIYNETKQINDYFIESIKVFPTIFDENFTSIDEVCDYLKKCSIQNHRECSGLIDEIPGWKCEQCSKYENTIYCSRCYLLSKEYHEKEFLKTCVNLFGGLKG